MDEMIILALTHEQIEDILNALKNWGETVEHEWNNHESAANYGKLADAIRGKLEMQGLKNRNRL